MIFVGILVLPTAVIPLVKAQEGTIILNPTDDAYTDGNNYNSNYGSELELKTLGYGRYLTWLKFNLSTIPEGAFGITAILELYTTLYGVTEPHDVVACLILNNSWTEKTITANNCPNYIGSVELDTDYVANDETWYEWLVTEAIVNATSNNATAVTILMRWPWGLQTPTISFTSKEASLTKLPKLTISWEGIIPEFPSFLILPLFIIATVLAVIVYKRKHSK